MDQVTNKDAALARIAGTQFGVISSRQLRDAGISYAAVARRCADGRMRKVLPSVFACGPSATLLARDGWCMAGVLEGGDRAALSHETAAARHAVWNRPGELLHVTCRNHRSTSAYDSPVVFHRSLTLTSSDIEAVQGVPSTSLTRTILDLGQQLSEFQIACVLCEASFLGVLDLRELESMLRAHRGAPGTAVVSNAIMAFRAGSRGTRSRSEDHLADGITIAGLPKPVVNNRSATPFAEFEPDFAWPEQRVVVEVDGGGHRRPGAQSHDRRVVDALERLGWIVRRFDAQDVWRHRARLVRDVARLLDARA